MSDDAVLLSLSLSDFGSAIRVEFFELQPMGSSDIDLMVMKHSGGSGSRTKK